MALALAACTAFAGAPAAEPASITPFSTAKPGELPKPWQEMQIPRVKPGQHALVSDAGVTVLQVRAEAAAGTATHTLDADPRATPVLSWRWKVDRVLERADIARKSGDDFAARVYVFFDVPIEELSWTQRLRIRAARTFYGRDVPTAALCYVWDNRAPAGTIVANAYTERVKMIVLESGGTRAGQWVSERRNVEDDFRQAFALPADTAVPRITGLAAAADTDQTGESVTAWFGDFHLEARR